jgi:hypothetical protein
LPEDSPYLVIIEAILQAYRNKQLSICYRKVSRWHAGQQISEFQILNWDTIINTAQILSSTEGFWMED